MTSTDTSVPGTQSASNVDQDEIERLQTDLEATGLDSIQYEADYRVILVGRTGSGKSTLGNILLNRKDDVPAEDGTEDNEVDADELVDVSSELPLSGFVVNSGSASVTKTITDITENNALVEKTFQVVDTPGLYDTESKVEETQLKLAKVMALSLPGPHAILFVVRCDVRFTDEESESFNKVLQVFGENVIKHVIIIFTRGDQMGRRGLRTYFDDAPQSLKAMMERVGDNYTLVGKTRHKNTRLKQLQTVVAKIDNVVRTHNFFSNDAFQKISAVVEIEAGLLARTANIPKRAALFLIKRNLAHDKESVQKLKEKIMAVCAVGAAAFMFIAKLR